MDEENTRLIQQLEATSQRCFKSGTENCNPDNVLNADEFTKAFWLEKLLINSASDVIHMSRSKSESKLGACEMPRKPDMSQTQWGNNKQMLDALEGVEHRIRRLVRFHSNPHNFVRIDASGSVKFHRRTRP